MESKNSNVKITTIFCCHGPFRGIRLQFNRMKIIITILIFFLFPASNIFAQNEEKLDKENCLYNGYTLHGKIQFVESFPDITIKVVESFPDLEVKIVDSFPDDCGEWLIVDSFPDLKVKIVESFADIKVKFVDSFPGIPR